MIYKKSIKYIVIIMSVLVSLTACQANKKPITKQNTSINNTTVAPGLPSSTQQKQITTSTAINVNKEVSPPSQLDIIEYNSANIVFDIIKSDWSKAEERLNLIKTNLNTVKPLLTASSVQSGLIDGISTSVTNLENYISTKKVNESKKEANNITKYVPDMEDAYKVTIHSDLSRLSYLDREIHININQGDWLAADENFKILKDLWNKVYSKIDANHRTVTNSFSNNFLKLENSIKKRNAKNTVISSNALLSDIGSLKNYLK